jgi:hypothetical protein
MSPVFTFLRFTFIDDAQIIVSIVAPGAPWKATAVYPSSPVSVLNAVVPNSDLFFHGQTPIETRSFSFYGIHANAMIVAMRRLRRRDRAAWLEERSFGDIARHFGRSGGNGRFKCTAPHLLVNVVCA